MHYSQTLYVLDGGTGRSTYLTAFLLTRSLVSRMKKLLTAADGIAAGDVDQDMTPRARTSLAPRPPHSIA
jgi:hypothetical protein